MDQEQRFCPTQDCTTDFWLVRHVAPQLELWHVVDRFGGGSFTIAATDPVCPRCGATLCLTVELTQRIGGNILEAGKVLEFVRSLR